MSMSVTQTQEKIMAESFILRSEDNEILLRRTLPADLNDIQELLDSNAYLKDDVSEAIREWHSLFVKNIRHPKIEHLLNHFGNSLQQILLDAIYQIPLDNDVLIGSDGQTYGKKALSVYLYSTPKDERTLLTDDFFVEPHPIACKMVEWLSKNFKKLHFLSEEERESVTEIDDIYNELEKCNELPILPTKEEVKELNEVNKIRLITELFYKAKFNPSIAVAKEILAEASQLQVEHQAAIDQFKKETDKETNECFSQIKEQQQRIEQEDQKLINALDDNWKEVYRQLKERITVVTREITELENANEEQARRIDTLSQSIDEVAKGNEQLKLTIEQLKVLDKKNKKKRLNGLVKAVALGCVAVLD